MGVGPFLVDLVGSCPRRTDRTPLHGFALAIVRLSAAAPWLSTKLNLALEYFVDLVLHTSNFSIIILWHAFEAVLNLSGYATYRYYYKS